MWYPNELDYLSNQEHHKKLLHEAEQERLIQTARLDDSGSRKLNLNITNWLGAKLVSWGMNLRQPRPAVAPVCGDVCC